MTSSDPTHASHVFDPAKAEAFATSLIGVLNHGALALMLSVGHRTQLFDALSSRPPATSTELAKEAGLNERYVREWLGAMTVSGVVSYRPENQTYELPPEHAALLTRAAAPDNLAAFMQYVAVLGTVEDDIIAAFEHGQGVPYAAYRRFHEVMAEESAQTVVAGLFEHILPLVPGLAEQLEAGIDVLDVGCGSGRALLELAAHFPASRFTGLDLSEATIAVARSAAASAGLGNATFEQADVAAPFGDAHYHLITTFDAVHDQAQPERVLANVARALRPGGTFLMQDIAGSRHLEANLDHPVGTFLYTISCMHCMSVSLAAGGPGLGAMWGKETALRMLGEAGFGDVRVEQLEHDFQNYYYLATQTAAMQRGAAAEAQPEADAEPLTEAAV